MNDSIGDRMKFNYEDRNRIFLTRRTPVIMRLDGRAFHTLTKGMPKPYCKELHEALVFSGNSLLKEIQGVKVVYIQSDEISLLITDFDKLTTEAWFDYNVQKMCSVAASMTTVSFHRTLGIYGTFDCRVFNIPREEVCNYFVWRQKDWMRNSVSMLAQSVFSHKELQNKSTSDMHEMLHQKNINWANYDNWVKNGTTILLKNEGPPYRASDVIFTEDRQAVEQYLGSEND
jgi:tRNA(His) 5'-end guanylyltransferase